MVELLTFAVLAFAAVVVLTVLASVFGMVLWLVTLPFHFLGWIMKGFGLLLAIPFVAIFGVVAFVILGAGMLMFLLPLLPFALLVWGAWWLVRRTGRSAASVTR